MLKSLPTYPPNRICYIKPTCDSSRTCSYLGRFQSILSTDVKVSVISDEAGAESSTNLVMVMFILAMFYVKPAFQNVVYYLLLSITYMIHYN